MGQPWILAIDLGNGGPKVGAVALTGEILRTSLRGVATQVGSDGTATQDAAEWLQALTEAVCEMTADQAIDPVGLHAIAITGQWGSTVPVGEDGRACGPVILWADTRGARHVQRIVGGPLNVGGYGVDKIWPWLRATGGVPSPNGGDPTGHALLLRNELREVGDRARVLLEPVDYLAFRLTGQVKATQASMILSWLTDNRIDAEPRYLPDLVRRAKRDPRLLPPLVPTGSVQGELLADVAESFGVPAGVPVITGIPDFHAAVIGSGAIRPYETHLAISTTSWFSAPVPFKKTDVIHQIATVDRKSVV